MRTLPDLDSRVVYYAARDYADQLRQGEGYHLLTPTISIVWLVEPLFPSLDRLHSTFELRERHTHTLFNDHLSIHVVQLHQLQHLQPSDATGYHARVERWARFLVAKTDAEFDRLASEDPIMRTAKEALDQLSLDPEARRLIREREDSKRLYLMSLLASEDRGRVEGEARGRVEGEARGRAEGEARGRAEGEARGKAELLLKLMGLRFGHRAESARARIEAAPPEQLDTWAERVLTAETSDDVFAP